ncbi:MAG: MCE family protein, partial [Phycisphaerales bacterium]|nr:MCE family protein [Phycisphaerales bacterium]
MKDRTRDAMIGLCAIAALGSFITILQLFGELPGPPTWRMTFMTRSTSGLADNSKVQLDGVPIGTIESVELSGNPDWPVRITTRIDEAIEIPLSVVPLTTTSLLTGAANLYLESAVTPGDSGVFLRDGSAVMNCEIQSAAIRDIVNAIDRRVGPALSAIGGLAPLLGSSGDSEFPGIPDLVREANKTVQAVREWVEDPTLRKQADEAMHLA